MLFSKWIRKNDADTTYKYVGAIYGDDDSEYAGTEVADLMESMGDENPLIDHPANTNRGGGFYFQSDDIWYQSEDNLTQECVFEKVE